MKHSLIMLSRLTTVLLLSVLTANSYAAGIQCPEGFSPIPSGQACAATKIASYATVDIPPEQNCPRGFERPAGVRFCIANNLTLNIQNQITLIAEWAGTDCPKDFSKPVGSTICIADNLVLNVIDNEVKLVAYQAQCPAGFHKPAGVRFCIPENLTSKILPTPTGQFCPPGFIRPPGVHFCIAANMLLKDPNRRNDLPLPQGLCPKGWHKPEGINFCIPSHETQGCGTKTECGRFEVTQAQFVGVIDNLTSSPCPAGTVPIWWDMPVYDDDGLFVINHVPTRTCIPENLEPAG